MALVETDTMITAVAQDLDRLLGFAVDAMQGEVFNLVRKTYEEEEKKD